MGRVSDFDGKGNVAYGNEFLYNVRHGALQGFSADFSGALCEYMRQDRRDYHNCNPMCAKGAVVTEPDGARFVLTGDWQAAGDLFPAERAEAE